MNQALCRPIKSKKYAKKWVNSWQNSPKSPNQAKKGNIFTLCMLRSKPVWKSTPPPFVTVLINMSYDLLFWNHWKLTRISLDRFLVWFWRQIQQGMAGPLLCCYLNNSPLSASCAAADINRCKALLLWLHIIYHKIFLLRMKLSGSFRKTGFVAKRSLQ